MNPHDQLIADHNALRSQAGALKTLAAKKSDSLLGEALVSFQHAVQKHFKREDAYFRILDQDKRVPDRGLVHQLRNDHAAVIFTMESLAIRLRKNGLNPDWLRRFEDMMNVFLPHLDQEEKHLFTFGRRTLTPVECQTITTQFDRGE